MDDELRGAVAAALGSAPVGARPVGGGYTPAQRLVLTLADGRTVFTKQAVNEMTAAWLRIEERVYRGISGPFLPEMLGFVDGPRPLLLLEDLSGGHWPPPWTPALVGRARDALAAVAGTTRPSWLPHLEDIREDLSGWHRVADDPAPFLRLGLCDSAWLDHALPILLEAEREAALDGDEMLHLDVRSDNICFIGARTLLIDWNNVHRGNAAVEVVAWAPSLYAEGGPPPEETAPGHPQVVGLICGYFASHAGLPVIPDAPRVRDIQLVQLRVALPWAARALGLPPPTAPSAYGP